MTATHWARALRTLLAYLRASGNLEPTPRCQVVANVDPEAVEELLGLLEELGHVRRVRSRGLPDRWVALTQRRKP